MRGALVLSALAAAVSCAPKARSTPVVPSGPAVEPQALVDGLALAAGAEQALAAGDPARAVALFGRALAGDPSPEGARAFAGLARAHEQLRDFPAAIRAYDAYLARHDAAPDAPAIYARRGACEAEVEQWERSAHSFSRARELGARLPPSFHVEARAREGYALFRLDRFEEADAALAQADEIHERAMADESERFSTYYFVGMARFYRAAILHRRFRDLPIRLPESQMARDFRTKLDVLVAAQEAYNHTIRAKHVFWVSAAGYQLGSLFEEFYDALMYAPVPDWLDAAQRRIYYEELKKQLRPVVDKAAWVFEKNLETARRLGYENQFIDQTEERLAQLQGVLLAGDTGLGQPHPRLAPPEVYEELEPPRELARERLPAVDRKLFVPSPTPL